MVYDLTAMINGSNLGQIAVGTNVVLGNFPWYGMFILTIMFLITFIYLMGKGYRKASCFATSCWVITILALLLRPLGLINSWMFWICIFATPVSIFFLWLFAHVDP